MSEKKLENYIGNYDNCPIRSVLDRIGDKWSILIIITLAEKGVLRFNELNHLIGNISQKMLTVTLKSLEVDGLISRKVYAQIPPKVEYTLTSLGKSLIPAMGGLVQWAEENMPAIKKSRAEAQRPELVEL